MTAVKDEGWYADHDDTIGNRGDHVLTMIKTIIEERNARKTITFMWLDLKNPDHCDVNKPRERDCSIQALQHLATKFLEPLGVRVMYGYYKKTKNGNAYNWICDHMGANEALNLDGMTKEVAEEFESRGPSQIHQRVMSYGWWNIGTGFGDCKEKDFKTCTELRQGVASRKFGKVFGWTSGKGDGEYVDKLLGEAGIDGLIYGKRINHYTDDSDTRAASQDILPWIKNRSGKYHIALQHENPW